MISIIISSANNSYLQAIYQNVEQTIGVPYEIIASDNSNGQRGICEIYNDGAKKAKFDILCFMHEDLRLLTENWGLNVNSHFENNTDLGIIGVVGSSYKPLAPSGWGAASAMNNVYFSNYIQHYKHEVKPAHLISVNPSGDKINQVACVDGMWFCTRKSIALSHPFDEILLTGFHCYDIDFCLNVGGKFKVGVIFDILMEHFSEGSYNRSWMEDTISLHKKWQSILPVSTIAIDDQEKDNIEKRAFKMLFKKLKEMDYSYAFSKQIIENVYKVGKLKKSLYYKLHLYLLKYYLIGFKGD